VNIKPPSKKNVHSASGFRETFVAGACVHGGGVGGVVVANAVAIAGAGAVGVEPIVVVRVHIVVRIDEHDVPRR